MRFMNRWDIDEAVIRWRCHPILGPATRTLAALRDAADATSDGWAYWPKPTRAAAKLMQLIEGDRRTDWWDDERVDVTSDALRKAYAPIKAFRTTTGIRFDIHEPTLVVAEGPPWRGVGERVLGRGRAVPRSLFD